MGTCQNRECKKTLPAVTVSGNPIPLNRQKKQKYCNNACSRTETARRARDRRMSNIEAVHNFLYRTGT